MLNPGRRLPRFRRAKSDIPAIQITKRDLQILRLVAEHRFLRSSQIVALVEGSQQQVLRRLQRLFHQGYLSRPLAQIDYYHVGGSRELVYGLDSRGAGCLRRDLDLPFDRMDWSGKNKSVRRVFLEHALLISDVMTIVERACQTMPNVRLLSPYDLPAPPNGKAPREPFGWSVNISTRHHLGVIPDQVFGLEYSDADGRLCRAWFFLEADRATMPVTRQNLNQSSVFRKLLAYEATWIQDLHRTKLGLPRFRVLTVTNSAERAHHMLACCKKLERGHGLFLFADLATLMASPHPLRHQWLGTHEGGNALLP